MIRAIASIPASNCGPRSNKSSARTRSSHARRASPALTSGCLRTDNNMTGANCPASICDTVKKRAPTGSCANGRPALSSASMFHRFSWAATRDAISRSGVTSATRLPSASTDWRIRTEMARASSALSSASSKRTLSIVRRARERFRHATVCWGRQKISCTACAVLGGILPNKSTSLRSIPMRCSNNLR